MNLIRESFGWYFVRYIHRRGLSFPDCILIITSLEPELWA
jgi:hypothetical protein